MGMAAVQVNAARQADEDRIVANIRMGLAAVSLEPVTVSARSGARSDRTGPGGSDRNYNPEQLTRLTIDVSDVNTVATLQPGVLGIRGSDSTATAFSVAGQRPTANNITMDGMSFGSGSVPQDAVRSLRVITNSYDVARGQFSGGLVASATRGGTNVPQGSFTYALRDRSLEWGEVTSSPFGQGMTQNQLGGGMGGPIVANKLFVFAALQGRWRGQLLPSLVSADPGTLVWLGVNPDSAARFVTLAGAPGAPVTVSGLSGGRATNNALGLRRLDWQASDVHTLTLRLDGNWESQEPTRVGSLALPATGGTRPTRGGGVMASLTSFFGGRFINELRGYVARQRRDATAFLTLPSGYVDVGSALPTGGQTVVALAFGGNSGLPQHTNTGSLELADEFSWLPGATAHRLKVGVDVIGTRLEENQTGNQFGTFVYPSLAALAADSPAMFTRTVVSQVHPGTAWNSALYAGDTWRVGGSLRLTYGARLEAARFSGAPLYNRAVDSLFGVRTDRIPDEVHRSPRRASFALLHRFGSSYYWVTLEGNYARGVSQYGFRDLNLVTTPRFTLPDEAGRPVYVPVDSIVPTTGAVSSVGSRIHPEFGDVLLVGSDLQSDTKQLILSFTGAMRWGASFRLGYTFTRARDQSSYSCCSASAGFAAPTTAGDPNVREWGTSGLERRHALVGTVTLPVTRGLEVSAIGNVMSGAPFTPIVGSDINGDGAKNDRAFIFNPALTADTAIANGIQALLAAAPSPIRSCLRRQLGGIAARNSCTGPWQASLDLQVNWRPEWFGFDRRLTMSLLTVNLLGGLHEWRHGRAQLRGWGYAPPPDPLPPYLRR